MWSFKGIFVRTLGSVKLQGYKLHFFYLKDMCPAKSPF